ncbi:prolyl endopeptidase [Melampsora larici-populina 98AG31]|uniref:Prolyl endopeptidase n=1 Tax=Melampsora larici-populina (strain 98AG31 / pathotype 3-4-7) TaxID=747676 RepID=F4RMI1_MELLP|nr:prolyl endopeptidase [Melampsora larici-populina 98AG31]EGG06431.1 prolyl endopeptidase [Melampsora larici-populina 98AG31]
MKSLQISLKKLKLLLSSSSTNLFYQSTTATLLATTTATTTTTTTTNKLSLVYQQSSNSLHTTTTSLSHYYLTKNHHHLEFNMMLYKLTILFHFTFHTDPSCPSSMSSNTLKSTATDSSPPTHWDPKQTPYPKARRDESFKETFKSQVNGEVEVHDPYHWLHEPPNKSEETQKFVNDQAEFTKSFLSNYSKKDELHSKILKNWDYPKFSCHSLKGDGYYYFNYNSGLQHQSILYRIKKGQESNSIQSSSEPGAAQGPGGSLFFDPNLLSLDGTASLSSIVFSKPGNFVAYGVSLSGSDWTTIYVRRSDSPHLKSAEEGGKRGEDPGRLDDVIRFVKFGSATWLHDESGFFYQRFPEKNQHGSTEHKSGTDTGADLNAMVYFHKLGDPQEKDILILEDPENPEYMWGTGVTDDGKYLIMSTAKDSSRSNRLWIAKLDDQSIGPNLKWHKIVNEFGNEFDLSANDGSRFYIVTNKDAPKRKVVVYDLEKPELGFQDLIPEDPNAILETFFPIHQDKVIIGYSKDVKDELFIYELYTGKKIKQFAQDIIGSCAQITGKREHNEFFFMFTGFLSPGTIYRYNFDAPEGKEMSLFRVTELSGLNPDEFVSKQVFYKSKDGTQIPMFITHRKDFKQDGTAPGYQYGYGGFSISINPFFSPALMTFVAHYGAVLAVPNIRGGGEYGEDWHLAGTKEKKQNVFDDFQYATKYLVDHKYVDPTKVTINGGSNGGLLVAACVNQAPELYGAALAEVGVLDMLRFHRFTIGRAWTADYGNPDEGEAFDYLIKYSPLHNVDPKVTYPALMLLTADHDDRVVPLHSFKFAAELQYRLSENPNPLLLRLDLKAGHGAGKSTAMRIQEFTDKLSFVAMNLGLEWRD